MSPIETSKNHIEKLVNEIREFSIHSETQLSRIIPENDNEVPEDQENDLLLINDLKILHEEIDRKIDLVDRVDLTSHVLIFKLYELNHEFRTKMEDFKKEKERIMGGSMTECEGTAEQFAKRLVEIDNEIENLEEYHQAEIHNNAQLKLEMELTYEQTVEMLNKELNMMKKTLNDLTTVQQNKKPSTPSGSEELISEHTSPIVEEYQQILNGFIEIQSTGWRAMSAEDRINAKLEEIGLKITKSGNILTKSGRLLTLEEAKQLHLLDDTSLSWDLIFSLKSKKSEEIILPLPIKSDQLPRAASIKSKSSSNMSQMTTEDVNYLKENLGTPLTLALAEITAIQPKDPIHYLGHWLFKYRYNQEAAEFEQQEENALTEERERIAKDKWHKFLEGEARAVLLDLIIRAEEEHMKNELRRIEKELLEQQEEENLDEEARDRFENYDAPAL